MRIDCNKDFFTMPPLTFMLFQAGLAVLLTLGQLLLTSPGMAQGHQDLPQLDPGRLRVVRGAPFCADAVHGMQQLLADGNRINMQSRSRTCRDSDGRLRQEF
ncbi:MAG: hypothetical protein EBV68_05630, partial [Betaproteobacteria bacterium]|nr:hypothetical protein [Betaproteobacteria bacterium]